MPRRVFALAAFLLLAAAAPAAAQSGPKASFDCAKARTPVERMICEGPNFLADLDRALAEIFRAVLASGEQEIRINVERTQKQWLAMRDTACGRAKPDAECLARLYKARIIALVAHWRAFGGAPPVAITGRYAYREKGEAGELFIAEMPDGTTYVHVETVNVGHQSPHSCTFIERVKERRGTLLVHRDPAVSKTCAIEIEVTGGRAVMREAPKDCFELARNSCGMHGFMLGNYVKR